MGREKGKKNMQEIKAFLHFSKRGNVLGVIAAPKKVQNSPWHGKKKKTFWNNILSQSGLAVCM